MSSVLKNMFGEEIEYETLVNSIEFLTMTTIQ